MYCVSLGGEEAAQIY